MELTKDSPKGKNYKTNDNFTICYRYKNSISGDNNMNKEEIIYLINGSIELTIEDKVEDIKSPAQIKIPENIYHKIKALTDISFILITK